MKKILTIKDFTRFRHSGKSVKSRFIISLLCQILLFLTYTGSLFGQEPVFEWAKGFGGYQGSYGKSIAVDYQGNVYTTGGFTSYGDFDPGLGITNLSNQGILDIFVSKLDSTGQFLWAVSFGDAFVDVGLGITTDALGNVLVTGCFSGTIDFDPGPNIHNLSGNENIFVLKLDTNGNFLWAKSMGGIDDDEGESVVVDEDGNVYTTGSFRGTADFDPGPDVFNLTAVELSDAFVSKLDSNGHFLWAKGIGGAFSESGKSIDLDRYNNVYTVGYFGQSVDFNPGVEEYILDAIGAEDLYVSKLTSDGDFLWAKNIGGVLCRVRGNGIAIDSDGNVYTTGKFGGGITDFDPGIGISNIDSPTSVQPFVWDAFISKLDQNGNYIWATSFGGSNSIVESNAIAVDHNDHVYVCGDIDGTVDFDPGTGIYNLSGNDDVFISKFEKNGSLLWAGLLTGVSLDAGLSIELDQKFNIYSTGKILNPTDVDPGPQVYGLNDRDGNVFVQKMNQPCAPKPTIKSSTSSFALCPEDSIILVAEMPDCITEVSYFWNTGDSTDLLQVTPDSISTYTVYANYINSGVSCYDSSTVDISFFNPIPISIIGDLEHCEGEEFILEIDGEPPYNWNTGDTTSLIATTSLETQIYAVTATDSNGCLNSDSVTVLINPLPEPTIMGNTEICPGDTLTLMAEGGDNYLWNTGSSENNLYVIPLLSNSEYSVTVTDLNACTGSTSKTVLFNEEQCPPCPIFPSAFTPDGDGVNDSFRVVPGEKIKVLNFAIYNRWGVLIHNSIQPWNGLYNEKPQPMDVYLYKAIVASQCGVEQFTGEVTLIR